MSVIYKNGTYYGAGGGGEGADTEIIADDFDSTESYAVGEYVVYEGVLYKCTTAHTGDWDASDFDDTQVMAEMPTPMPAADMSEIVTPKPGVMSRTKIYSPEEQVVAEWREYVNGVLKKKPVYQRTLVATSSTVSLSGSASAVAGISDVYSSIKDSIDVVTTCMFFCSPASVYANRFEFKLSDGTLDNMVGSGSVTYTNLSVILQYTKTTDEWEVV